MERDPLAKGKENALRLGAHIVFIDESGFLLIPPIKKRWTPRGQTPIIRHHQIRSRISAISGISISPKRKRLGLYFSLFETNIHRVDVAGFLHHLLRHLRGHVIIIWDNALIHRGKDIQDLCRTFPRLHLEDFPPYAPDLNPDEENSGSNSENSGSESVIYPIFSSKYMEYLAQYNDELKEAYRSLKELKDKK